jgi:photosystem II stability/assembly factor-like uncharacterized protein
MAANSSAPAADISASYTWKPLRVGGGGFVTGMWAHPTAPGLIYCRVDVAAGYRWDAAASTWKNLVTVSSMPQAVLTGEYEGVDSLVGAKSDPRWAYMAYDNKIYKSVNQGDQWVEASTGFRAAMDANGPARTAGERLGVDPANKNVVYYASIRDGLWFTFTGGDSWSQVSRQVIPFGTEPDNGVLTVQFDENSGVDAIGRTKTIYVTVCGEGVFQTLDAGTTWKKISGGGGPPDDGSAVDAIVDNNGNYYIADSKNGAVWRYSRQGQWAKLLSGAATAVTVDPFDPRHIVVMISGGALMRSTDFGYHWTSLSPVIDDTGDTPWLVAYHRPFTAWLSTGQLVFDPTIKGKLWFAEGFGVMTASDLSDEKTIHWTCVNNGIESLCSNQIIHPPGGVAVGTGWDLGGFRFANPDKPAAAQIVANKFLACWGIDWMGSNPRNLVTNVTTDYNWSAHAMQGLARSADGGLTWTLLSDNLPADLKYGTVAVSAGNAGHIVWLPANKSGVYCTRDGGVTWARSAQNVSLGWVSFTLGRKALASDKVLNDVFYIMREEDRTLYKSTDGGAAWVSTGAEPGGPYTYRYNSELKAVPGKAGHLWYAGGRGDTGTGTLWRSTDGGATWTRCAHDGLTQAWSIGFGKEPAPGGYPAIFLNGVVNGIQGIYRSIDEGNTWDLIGRYPFGIWSALKCIDGDKDVFGKVYFGFSSGIGFGYGTMTGKP